MRLTPLRKNIPTWFTCRPKPEVIWADIGSKLMTPRALPRLRQLTLGGFQVRQSARCKAAELIPAVIKLNNEVFGNARPKRRAFLSRSNLRHQSSEVC